MPACLCGDHLNLRRLSGCIWMSNLGEEGPLPRAAPLPLTVPVGGCLPWDSWAADPAGPQTLQGHTCPGLSGSVPWGSGTQ